MIFRESWDGWWKEKLVHKHIILKLRNRESIEKIREENSHGAVASHHIVVEEISECNERLSMI